VGGGGGGGGGVENAEEGSGEERTDLRKVANQKLGIHKRKEKP